MPPAKRGAALPEAPEPIGFERAEDFEAWLEANDGSCGGLWVKLAKKGSGIASIDYATALEAALCFGWIDGRKRSLDEDSWLQRFTPRSPRGRWSRINRDKATALIEAGRMRPAGQREVDLAQADGRWDAAYEGQRSAAVPEDLQAAFDADPEAAAFFTTLDSANRYAVLYRVHEAKRAETRARRIEKLVAMLHAHETIHPQRTARKSG
ncbi:YdeI/OmpD-associated family protein [Actinospica robiniae]|uniref:YdeI/OmpD-associated family protein n=1 Tax=Actinospica robiniae TaxID=304901 RepID=UPI0004055468|nr:YdeI/OmpD-associated family protein [Actinospica robiniae]